MGVMDIYRKRSFFIRFYLKWSGSYRLICRQSSMKTEMHHFFIPWFGGDRSREWWCLRRNRFLAKNTIMIICCHFINYIWHLFYVRIVNAKNVIYPFFGQKKSTWAFKRLCTFKQVALEDLWSCELFLFSLTCFLFTLFTLVRKKKAKMGTCYQKQGFAT